MSQTNLNRPHIFYVAILIVLTLWMALPGIASIPVIDRDEARYAQATVQMVETDDYINIRFQDKARNKKPAGIYWMQAGFVKAFTDPGERKIWAHRLPSVIGALLAVLATYWGALAIFRRRGAFYSAALLSLSALFVFEAHIAKTDAMLCAMSAICLASLLRLQHSPNSWTGVLFWAALGLGILIKGPILPVLIVLSLISFAIWNRNLTWAKSLINLPGILLCLAIVLPWSIAIWFATDGAFYVEALGGDLAPKLAGGHEKHGGLPGYYLATLPILLWPGSIIILAGLTFAFKASRNTSPDNQILARAMRLLLCWALPFWLLLELTPTKLTHYLLPTYPALAMMGGGVLMALLNFNSFKISRRIGAVLFLIITILLLVAILSANVVFADTQNWALWGVFVSVLGSSLWGVWGMWTWRLKPAVIGTMLSAFILSPTVYQFVLPHLDNLFVSRKIETALTQHNIDLPRLGKTTILSPDFTEPSLVYYLGTDILLGHRTEKYFSEALVEDHIVLVITDSSKAKFKNQLKELEKAQKAHNICFNEIDRVRGLNYSKGDEVEITLLITKNCQN